MQGKCKYFLLQKEKGQKDQYLAELYNINWLQAQELVKISLQLKQIFFFFFTAKLEIAVF